MRNAASWIGAAVFVLAMSANRESSVHAFPQDTQGTNKLSRMDRLDLWIQSVNQHEPGAADGAVETVNAWSASDLQWVLIDLASVVSLVRDSRVRQFFLPNDRELRWDRERWVVVPIPRSTQLFYSGGELKRLQGIAASLRSPAEGKENLLLKRGAMLHADVAMFGAAASRPFRGSAGAKRYRLTMDDGRPTGLETEVNHWELGRRLLGRIRVRNARGTQGPGADEAVRLWYVSTCGHMLSIGQLDPSHFAYGLDLFPTDPDILFMNAALHETMARGQRQAAMRKADVPLGVTFAMMSAGAELAEAEHVYRRALESDLEFGEARLRYGRVLSQRGRHQDALAELQKASTMVEGPLLQYFANLFLGGELEALGRNDEAVAAYERAALLFPTAQSPRLAISRLASATRRTTAREQLLSLVSQPAVAEERDDPWWVYDVSAGRAADIAFARLHKMLEQSDR